jgi:Mn2+/Fe2+ NRAMP family transporter
MNILKRIRENILFGVYPYVFRRRRHIRDYFRMAKNGTITGAADNDPSGIITYTQVGALTGFALLWLLVLVTPLLIAIEDMSARIGVVAKKSLANTIRAEYGFRVALLCVSLVAIANVATIGANIAGMSEVLSIITNIPWALLAVVITLLLALFLIRGTYSTISRYFFLLTPVFLAYVVAAIILKPNTREILLSTINPFLGGGLNYWLMAVALIGTTISPYLVFWQNTEEIEEKKSINDLNKEAAGVKIGMIYSNLIAYFVIIVAGLVLFKNGLSVDTARQAAELLRPIAGDAAYGLFSLGFLGSGLLAAPILASCTAYIFSDVFHWKEGLDKRVAQARGFYVVLLVSLFFGLFTIFLGLSPIKMLVYSQVLDGLVMPVLIYSLLKVANNKKIMGDYTNKLWVNVFGWSAFLLNLGLDMVLIWQWMK